MKPKHKQDFVIPALPAIIDPILRMRETSKATGLSDALLYELIAKGGFPKPFQLVPNGRAMGWKASTIAAWINARAQAAA